MIFDNSLRKTIAPKLLKWVICEILVDLFGLWINFWAILCIFSEV